MEQERQCCGTCQYHVYCDADDDWICTSDNSEASAWYTEYDDVCKWWEARDDG